MRFLDNAVPFTKFSAPLNVVKDEVASAKHKKELYVVKEAFKFYVGEKEADTWVCVPEGFLTDGASVPKIFQWLIKPWGKHGQAAVVHDILCEQYTIYVKGEPQYISYNRAHKIFKEALKVLGVNSITIFTMYWAVRSYFFVTGYKVDPKLFLRNRSILTNQTNVSLV